MRLVRVSTIEKDLNMTRGALNYRIKKQGVEKIYKFNGQGSNVVCVKESDLQLLLDFKRPKYEGYEYLADIASRSRISIYILGKICKLNDIVTVRGSNGFKPEIKKLMISAEDAVKLRAVLKKRKYEHAFTKSSSDIQENRMAGFYTRLSSYKMMDSFQGVKNERTAREALSKLDWKGGEG